MLRMERADDIVQSPNESNTSEKDDASPPYHEILHDIGEFGPYQVLVGLTVGFVFAYGSMVTMNFIFAVDIVEHRCWIPECEPNNSNNFHADWLEYAIPYNGGRLDQCSRYEFIGSQVDGSCGERNFNRTRIIACNEFIMENNEQRLLSHLNMVCTGANSKLALFGTANTLGRAIAMPITGLLADKFGRLITITVSALLGTIFSILQVLPRRWMTFELYLTLEFLAALLSTGMIGAGYIFNMEWTTAKYRVRITTISIVMEALIPIVAIGLAAWYYADDFIAYRLALAVPGSLMLALHFLLGESPQWLFAQHKSDRAIASLSKAAQINGKPLSAHTMQRIEKVSALTLERLASEEQSSNVSMVDVLRQRTLALRLLITSLIWVFIYFAYYGVFFVSTKVHDNKYLSFLLIGLADLPGNMANDLLLNRVGRRLTIGLTLPLYAAMLLTATQLPAGQQTLKLLLFVVGKAAITAAANGYHTFCAEFWPTAVRGTASNIGKTASQVGSILASVTVLLANYYAHLPVFLNAAAGILAAILVFAFLPETMHCGKLPDTMEEALAIGTSSQRKSAIIFSEAM